MRIVVKNLPEKTKKEEIEKFFSTKGTITDVYMLNDAKGVFRRTCFIGYKTLEEAEAAANYYNRNMFKNHKIRVELAKEKEETQNTQNESIKRKILYSKTVIIKQLTNMFDTDSLLNELTKIGEIEDFKIEKIENGANAVVKFKDGKNAVWAYENLKILTGMRVKVTAFNEKPVSSKKEYYNTLFFNFDTIIKKVSESSKIDRGDLVDLKDKDLGSRIAMLEADLVNQTKVFLENNKIYLDSIEPEKSKNVLIIRNSDILGVIDLVKGDCKVDVAPSKCLALLTFKEEKEALECFKSLNLRRFKNQIIFCEFAPICKDLGKTKEPKVIKNKSTKIIVKNVPFQATEKELKDIFSSYVSVTDVRLPINNDGKIKGYAFIVLDSPENVDKAIEYFGTNTHLYGRRLVLERAKS